MRKWPIAVSAALVVTLAGGGIAYASIPGSDGTVKGCYRSDTLGAGQLYVIDSGSSCPSGFTELDWNQSGISGYQVISNEVTSAENANSVSAEADCPDGDVALGGGNGGGSSAAVVSSAPVMTDETATGWGVTVEKFDPGTGGAIAVTTYVICATA